MNQLNTNLRSVPADVGGIDRRHAQLHKSIPESLGWDTDEVDKLLARSSQINAPADTILMNPRTICESFIMLLEGSVRVFQNADDGREITLYRIKPGDFCVMSLNSLLKQQQFNAVARSETPIHAISLSKRQFLGLMSRHEDFSIRVLSSLAGHFNKTLQLMEDLVFNKLESRLACLLGSMFEARGGGVIKATHQELANELGTTREVISRILKNLEQQGCLSLSRGKVSLAAENSPGWFQRNRNS